VDENSRICRPTQYPISFFIAGHLPTVRIPLAIVAALFLATCSRPATVLDQILYAGELRVVTRNSPSSYYLGANGPEGPELELAKRLATDLGVDLYIYSMPTLGEVLHEVSEGRADVAAAGLTLGQPLPSNVVFGAQYQEVKEHLVYRNGDNRPRNLQEAAEGHIEVASNSAHAAALEKLRNDSPDLVWVENPNTETEELLNRLTSHDIDYTIADSNEFAISRAYHPEIRVAFDLNSGKALAWAINGQDSSLQRRIAAFISTIKADGQLTAILERYYNNVRRFEYVQTRDFVDHVASRLPLYRDWFKEAGVQFGIDWRLLSAVGYQESQWTADATSPTGVRGLMMLTADTAERLDVSDRLNPEQSIFGGARYLTLTRNQIPQRIREPDRTWFALAAYNVGWGHVEDARILTQTLGKNPDHWDDVKQQLPLLSQEKWYSRTRNGYARGWEPVRFVDNIRTYFQMLQWMADPET
jgi:membrane-bound lytic murein transglycosylase F